LPKKVSVLIYLWLVSLAVLCCSAPIYAAGVQPLVFDLKAAPGESVPFEVVVSAQELQETVNVRMYSVIQDVDGSLHFANDLDNPAVKWVYLDTSRVVVPPNEYRSITGVVRVPVTAEGTYPIILMVEPEAGITSGPVTIRVRYAVRMVIHVDRPWLRPNITVDRVELGSDGQGNALVRAIVRNPSPLLFPLSAELTLRDESRTLVERIQLRPTGKLDPIQPTEIKIYPGAELWLDGLVTKPLFPGVYDVRLFTYYGDGQQRVHTHRFVVEDIEFASAKDQYLTVEPSNLAAELIPGGADSQVLTITNNTREQLAVEITAAEVADEYPHSVFEGLRVELRSPQQLDVDPRRSVRPVLVLRAPRDAKPGGYYGSIVLTAYTQDGELVSKQAVPLAAIVSGEIELAADIQGLTTTPVPDDFWMLSAVVQNLGSIHIVPTGTVYLKDSTGQIVRTVPLGLPDVETIILPEQTGLLVSPDFLIMPGEYTAEVHVFADGQELAVKEQLVTFVQISEEVN
jgi:hypothetical protein